MDVAEEMVCPKTRYEHLVGAIRTADKEATPMRVKHHGDARWINTAIKRAWRERNAG